MQDDNIIRDDRVYVAREDETGVVGMTPARLAGHLASIGVPNDQRAQVVAQLAGVRADDEMAMFECGVRRNHGGRSVVVSVFIFTPATLRAAIRDDEIFVDDDNVYDLNDEDLRRAQNTWLASGN